MRLLQIDAFADAPFHGNPAAVCFLDRPRDDGWMQSLAAEMNLSETAFLLPQEGGYSLRWMTPTVEVDLCGHATLASAHALWEESLLQPDETARFHTRSGLLTASRSGEWIELDFPVKAVEPIPPPPGLLEALGISSPVNVGRNQFDFLVEVDGCDLVRALAPDHVRLGKLSVRGVIVTSRDGGEYDFISRFFAPGSGIDEDPVTGSAHTALAPYWSERLGKRELLAYQASSRGGRIRIRLEGDRVRLGGRAVTIFSGQLAI